MARRAEPEAAKGWLGLGVFAGGLLLVLAVHPERFSGWALWALSPLFVYFAYLLTFRGPPQRTRMYVAAAVAGGYSGIYGLTAGFGDESYTDLARAVYLFLPALGLLAMIVCIPVVELLGALATARSERQGGESRAPLNALPFGPAVLVATALIGAWTTVALTGWASPKVVVASDEANGPALVARVRCEGGDTHLLTPTALRLQDGVHVRIDNRTDGELWLEYEIDGGAHGGGAELIAPGVSERLISIPGRSIGVVCSQEGNGNASAYATMVVVAGAAAPSR
jgi:hypothetical protein